MEKKWLVKPGISAQLIGKFPEINPLVLQLLSDRDIKTQKEIDQFLTPDYGEDQHDPFLFSDMEKAVKRIFEAIEKKQKIVIYGDYDADGVTATVVLYKTLDELGAKIDVYIPYRETEGYGLNIEAAKEIIKADNKLVITVDCGISNVEEVKILQDGGVDVVITDHHHEPPETPKAHAVINHQIETEKYPFKSLSGVGVAFKLVQAIVISQKKYLKNEKLNEGFEKWLLDLVSIGTVTDVVPLLGENRTLVKYGLVVLKKTQNIGLKKLVEVSKVQINDADTYTIGFQIGPRINAAGRMDHASTAYELLTTKSSKEAEKIALELNQKNQERQKMTLKILEEAKNIIGAVGEQKIIIAVGKGWPTGLVGLVAGRLSDQYNRPVLIIADHTDEFVGSGRSIEQFNIIEALDQCKKYLERYGGHKQACGFTIANKKNLDEFIKEITKLATKQLTKKDLQPVLSIDMEVDLEDISWDLYNELAKFEPFGEGNPKPIFLARKVNIVDVGTVGKNGNHLKAMVSHNSNNLRKTIGFSFGDWCDKLKAGDKIDMVFEVDKNVWNHSQELQLKIIDLKLSK
ncbi:single-stranded-DNA-specific exonuclease RecJ [Patescibacteria group bacterium]|nr:single-stranded-DNA-specific exonuclease RecJ [Patescibacteria group bacterium]